MGSLNINGSKFIDNSGSSIINSDSSTLILFNNEFIDSVVSSAEIISMNDNNLTITECNFTGTYQSGSQCGAFDINYINNLLIKDSHFSNYNGSNAAFGCLEKCYNFDFSSNQFESSTSVNGNSIDIINSSGIIIDNSTFW